MPEHYIRAAKALDIDIDKTMQDMVRPLVREELILDQAQENRAQSGNRDDSDDDLSNKNSANQNEQ